MTAEGELRKLGEAALAKLDHIIDEQPKRLSEAFSEAVRCVVRLRDALIERRRSDASDAAAKDWLERTNAMLSLLVGAEYPLKAVHWDSASQARDALRAMLTSA